MIGPYVVDEQPTQPMSVTIGDAQGVPLDLSVYDSVEIESEPSLPAGFVDFSTEAEYPGVVQYTYDDPFTEAGQYKFRFKLNHGATDAVDYTPWLEFDVRGTVDDEDFLITTDEVFRMTGIPVSVVEIAKATSLMSLYLDRDLSNDEWLDALSGADLRRMKTALAYWSASMADSGAAASAATNSVIAGLPSNVRSISLGDQSVTFSAPSDGSDGSTATSGAASPPALAQMALDQLSWRKGSLGTLYSAPFLTYTGSGNYDLMGGTTWDMAVAFSYPVVRLPSTDEQLWTVIYEEEHE